jgi:CheY-like chemotaxis protein
MAEKNSGSANRVLVLDDEPEICRYTTDLIKSLGFEVETASDAALVYLNELKDSDVVFIDIQMPGMDGLQVLEVLSRRNARCRIVLMIDTNEEPAVLRPSILRPFRSQAQLDKSNWQGSPPGFDFNCVEKFNSRFARPWTSKS